MRIYLAGPMEGYEDNNYPLFHSVAKELRAQNHSVYNPAEFSYEESFSINAAMRNHLEYLCSRADGIVMLPLWEASRGSEIEYKLSKYLGLKIMHWDPASGLTREEL